MDIDARLGGAKTIDDVRRVLKGVREELVTWRLDGWEITTPMHPSESTINFSVDEQPPGMAPIYAFPTDLYFEVGPGVRVGPSRHLRNDRTPSFDALWDIIVLHETLWSAGTLPDMIDGLDNLEWQLAQLHERGYVLEGPVSSRSPLSFRRACSTNWERQNRDRSHVDLAAVCAELPAPLSVRPYYLQWKGPARGMWAPDRPTPETAEFLQTFPGQALQQRVGIRPVTLSREGIGLGPATAPKTADDDSALLQVMQWQWDRDRPRAYWH